MRVSVVIVTFNGSPWIRRCLASLRASSQATHVIVVDNCSGDDTAAIVEREFADVELIRRTTNAGFGIGNNVGIARARLAGADYVFLLNQDAYVLPATIEALTRFMDEQPQFGIATPLHCSPDPDTVDRKTYLNYLQRYASAFLCDAALDRRAPHYRIHGINAAAWFVRESVFGRVGGFDPLFFMYGEDDDLIARFAQHDVAFGLLPSARIVHLRESVGSSPTRSRWDDVKRRAGRLWPSLVVPIKNPAFGPVHMAMTVLSQGIVAPFADYLIERDGRRLLAFLLASWQVLRQIPRIRQHARVCAVPGPHFLAGE